MKQILGALLILGSIITAHAQVLLKEDFEPRTGYKAGDMPPGWSQAYVKGLFDWKYQTGGENFNPDTAAQGNYNAAFIVASLSNERTKLVTPAINLKNIVKPRLRFQHVQQAWSYGGVPYVDELRIMYKTSLNGTWKDVTGGTFTSAVGAWTQRELLLDPADISTTYYIAFEGKTGYGHGTCIDNIIIDEAGSQPRSVSDVTVQQAATNPVASGSVNNPIIRIDVQVSGNTGALALQSLKVRSLNTSDVDVAASGVKLFATTNDIFSDQTPLATAASFVAGVATFSGMTYDLPFGTRYLWVTYDIANTVAQGHVFDAYIGANDITVSTKTFPSAQLSPTGNRSIVETLFSDGFETIKGWTLGTGFQIATPTGKGGLGGGLPDPATAANGTKVLGTGFFVTKDAECDYVSNLDDRAWTATSPELNCTFFKDVTIRFDRWLNLELWDNAYIDISTDGGINWTNVWASNQRYFIDSRWSNQEIDISAYANRQKSLKVRFSLGSTSPDYNYSGWNIDNFAITGKFISNDVSVTQFIAPGSGCGHTAKDTVVVRVLNLAGKPTAAKIPVAYSFDGGTTLITDTIYGSLGIGKDTVFKFHKLANLSQPGTAYPFARTLLTDDDEPLNDGMGAPEIEIIPTYTFPYIADYEINNGYWYVAGSDNSTWEWGKPSSANIKTAGSGLRVWKTNLTGIYNYLDSSFVMSPCFDVRGNDFPVVDMMVNANMVDSVAGASLQYTINDGKTWTTVPKIDSLASLWSWYNTTSNKPLQTKMLSPLGWSGNTPGWQTVRHFLPIAMRNNARVRFRMAFASHMGVRTDGFAFDKIRFYDAPLDIGVVAKLAPVDACEMSATEKLSIQLRNFGLDTLKIGTSITVGFQLAKQAIVKETFTLKANVNPQATFNYTFVQTLNLAHAGNYAVKLFSCTPADINFFGKQNDSLPNQVIRVKGMPDYDLGGNFGSEFKDSVPLDAQAGYTYLWDNGFKGQIRNIKAAGLYSVTVTNGASCTKSDTIRVIYSAKDLGIQPITTLPSKCAFPSLVDAKVTISNNHLDSFKIGSKIVVAYQINKDAPVVETITVAKTLFSGQTLDYTFNTKLNLSSVGSYVCKFYTVLTDDVNHTNDTAKLTIENWGDPKLDLGKDTIFTKNPVGIVFSAPAGFKTYKWQDNVTATPSFTVTDARSLRYMLTVTDVHDCGSTSDTVQLITYDFAADSLLSPRTSCSYTAPETVSFRLKNKGTDVFAAGKTIKISYSLNKQASVVESWTLPRNLKPDSSIVVDFATKVDVSKNQNYNLLVAASLGLDKYADNDTLDEDFSVWGYPVVNIGADTIRTTKPDTIKFVAKWPNATYRWTDDTLNDDALKVNDLISKLYVVTVTANGCSTKDSSFVWTQDINISAINLNKSYCELSSNQTVSVDISNVCNNKIAKGEKITIALAIDRAAPQIETITLDDSLYQFSSVTHTFTFPFNLSAVGLHNLKAYIVKANDVNRNNDTMLFSTMVYGYPKPDLQFDSIETVNPAATPLSVANDYKSYRWKKGSNNYKTGTYIYSLPDDAPDWYYVEVQNEGSCKGKDSVKVITRNIVLQDIINPKASCDGKPIDSVIVSLHNKYAPIYPNDTIILHQQLNGGTIYSDTLAVHATIKENSFFEYTFKKPISTLAKTNYNLAVWFDYKKDVNTSDNKSTITFSSFGNPTVDLGADTIKTMRPDTVILTVPTAFDTYFWSYGTDISNSQSTGLMDSVSRLYTVTVTDIHGCTASDSVFLSTTDLKLESVLKPQSACVFTGHDTVRIKITNIGLDLVGNKPIIARYQINGDAIVSEQVAVPSALSRNQSVYYSFNQTADLTQQAISNLKIWVTTAYDIDRTNDSTTKKVVKFPSPTLAFAVDSLFTTQPETETLDAGAGFVSYLWNDNSTAQTLKLTANSGGWYVATVFNSFGCGAADSVCVINRDLAIKKIISPLSACTLTSTETISVLIENAGAMKYTKGSEITAALLADGIEMAVEKFILDADLIQNDQKVLTFATKLDLDKQSKTISIQLRVGNDAVATNNIISSTVSAWGFPAIGFAVDTILCSRPDTLKLSPGAGFVSYLWSNNATTDTIKPSDSKSKFWYVTVSNSNNCSSKDSIYILNSDLSLSALLSPQNSCILTNNEAVELQITNAGTEIIPAGAKIPVHVWVDNVEKFIDTLKLQSPLAASGQTSLISKSLDLSGLTTASIRASITWSPDAELTNNTIQSTVSAFGKPSVGFTYDTLITTQADTLTLRAKTGYTNYSWSTGTETSNALKITDLKSAWYKVTIADAKNCSANDSVFIFANDIAVSNILPKSSCKLSATEKIHIEILNNGGDILATGTQIPLSLNVNGIVTLDTLLLTSPLAAKGKTEYISKQSFDMSKKVNYATHVQLSLPFKQVSKTNDSLSTNIAIWDYPTVALAQHKIKTNQPDTLKIALSGAAKYTWSDGSTNDTLFVSSHLSKWYFVTVDEGHGCTIKDSVLIVSSDLSLDKLVNPQSQCVLTAKESLQVQIKNFGADTLKVGTKLNVVWSMNGTANTNEEMVLSSQLLPNDSILWTSSSKLAMNDTGKYSLSAAIYRTFGDTKVKNDTQTVVVHHYGQAAILLAGGADTLRTALPYTLKAANKFAHYLWNDKSSKDSLVVNRSGKYALTATSQYGCETKDEVLVLAYDVALTQMIFPLPQLCVDKLLDRIDVIAKNIGKDTLPIGTIVKYRYKLKWVDVQNDNNLNDVIHDTTITLKLTAPWLPNATMNLRSMPIKGLAVIRDYVSGMTITLANDIDTKNNTIELPFKILKNITVNLYNGNAQVTIGQSKKLSAPSGYTKYEWSNGDTGQEISVSSSGNYKITVTDVAGCTASDDIDVVLDISGIDAFQITDIQVYPVPTQSNISVVAYQNPVRSFQIFDTKGRVVKSVQFMDSMQTVKIDFDQFAAGIYWIQFSTDHGLITKTIEKL